MKLVRYGQTGQEKPGLIDANGQLRDLSGQITDIDQGLLADLSVLKDIAPDSLPIVSGNPRFGPCVAGVGKFICIGLNYSDHAAENRQSHSQRAGGFHESNISDYRAQ